MTGVLMATLGTSTSSGSFWISSLDTTSDLTFGQALAINSSNDIYVANGTSTSGLNPSLTMNVLKVDTSGSLLWQRGLTGTSLTSVEGMALDTNGDPYLAGQTPVSSTDASLFAKYNSSGTIQWQRTLNGAGADVSYGAATDSSNNVYFVGRTDGSASVVKYNSSGTIQWQQRITTSSSSAVDVAIDSSSNVYMVGACPSGLDFDIGFLIKLNSSGVVQWSRQLGDGASSAGSLTGVAIDSSGNVYVVGQYGASGHLSKVNSSGTPQWNVGFSSGGFKFDKVAVDSDGTVYAAGSIGTAGAYVVKYNTSGTIQWQRLMRNNTGSLSNWIRDIATDTNGNIVITSWMQTATNSPTIGLAKLPADGSRTGTYTVSGNTFIYEASSLSTTTSLNTSSASLAVTTTSLTGATSTLTEAATSLTNSLTPI